MKDQIQAMRDVLLRTLIPCMESDEKIFFVTADLGSPVLDTIREKFPDRYINVGIAEQNLINVSTGLALEGFTVYAYAIAPFITMRCFEQTRVNLSILSQVREMNVNLIGVGAGYSYVVSGPTHQCMEDLSIMRTLPNMELFSPADYITVKEFVKYSLAKKCPKYLRLDAQPLPPVYDESKLPVIEQGFSELRKGDQCCIISTGYMTQKALSVSEKLAKEGVNIGVIDLFMLATFNEQALADILNNYSSVITFEEGFTGKGGLDSLILHFIHQYNLSIKFDNVGLVDKYNFKFGTRDDLHELNQGGAKQLIAKIKGLCL